MSNQSDQPEEPESTSKPIATKQEIADLQEAIESSMAVTMLKIGGDYIKTITDDFRETNIEAARIKAEAHQSMPGKIAEAAKTVSGLIYALLTVATVCFIGLCYLLYIIIKGAIEAQQFDIVVMIVALIAFGGTKLPGFIKKFLPNQSN